MSRHTLAALIAAVGLAFASPSKAAPAVLVLANATDGPVRFSLKHPNGKPSEHELAAGEVRPFPCGRHADAVFAAGGKAAELRLDGYSAYVFIAPKGLVELHGIDMKGKPVPLDDVPDAPPAVATPVKVPVKLLMDDAERRTRQVWEPAVRKRFEQAAEVVAAHCPVQFEVAGVGEWASNAEATDLSVLFAEFEKAVKPEPGRLTIGLTSRGLGEPQVPPRGEDGPFIPFAVARAALHPHILLREGAPRTEPERVEVLIQQLGKYLGAVHSPDPNSAMRPKLGDGKAIYARFRLAFDPLNTLAMNLWAEELRAGKVVKWSDLRPATQARLGRIYATLAEALPDERLPEEYAGLLKAAEKPAEPRVAVAPPAAKVEKPRPAPPKPAETKRPPATKAEAIRKVVKAIVQRAGENAARPDPATRLKGDELTAYYVKTAADVARFEDREMRPAAFLIGLGIALDDSEVLRKNPLAADLCKAVETDDERKRRLAVLGLPTVRKRRDLCQHFVVSAALTELIGAQLTEQAGLAKELLDMNRPTGFSFSDLCADLAGIEFARLTKMKPDLLDEWWRNYQLEDFVPKMDGLRDGLTEERFKQDYGSVGNERFKQAMDDVRKRVRAMKYYGKTDR
jgi:hypothetical protein